jgi:hypothetical protein
MAEGFAHALFGDDENRNDAKRLVKEAVGKSRAENRQFIDCLAALTNAPVAWDRLRDPRNACGAISEFIDRTLAQE